MKYVVTITEVGNDDSSSSVIRYQQAVDSLNIQAVIGAVNAPLQSPVPPARQRAKRSDAGKPRAKRSAAGSN